jgi:hypothetical protein
VQGKLPGPCGAGTEGYRCHPMVVFTCDRGHGQGLRTLAPLPPSPPRAGTPLHLHGIARGHPTFRQRMARQPPLRDSELTASWRYTHRFQPSFQPTRLLTLHSGPCPLGCTGLIPFQEPADEPDSSILPRREARRHGGTLPPWQSFTLHVRPAPMGACMRTKASFRGQGIIHVTRLGASV